MATDGETDPKRPRWLLWLHRIGYVTTALIAAQLVAIGILMTLGWINDRERRAAAIEETRTHETPLLPTEDRYVRRTAIELLKTLPPLSSLHGDGLRFVVMPSLASYHYAIAISLRPGSAEARGVLKTFENHELAKAFDSQTAPTVSDRNFVMPAQAYRSLAGEWDEMTDDWPGKVAYCLDGSTMAFERVREQRVTSGIGNCIEHYEQLQLLILKYIHRFAPGDDLPAESSWHRFDE